MAPEQDDNQVSQDQADQGAAETNTDTGSADKAGSEAETSADQAGSETETSADKAGSEAETPADQAGSETKTSADQAGAGAETTADQVGAEAGTGPSTEVPDLPDFSGMLSDAAASSIEMLKDVELNVKIELGRAEMDVESILHLTTGSVVELDKLAGDPVDILVNEQLIARGEVLVINDNFCVRINEIIQGVNERYAKIT